jgi:hypothetical protein
MMVVIVVVVQAVKMIWGMEENEEWNIQGTSKISWLIWGRTAKINFKLVRLKMTL